MTITAKHLFEIAGLKIPESLDTTIELSWTELKSEEGEEKDALDQQSKWSRNTYGGADNLLYGEARLRGKLVGRVMIGVFDDFLEIDKLWVDKSVRRQGVGRRLVSAAMDRTGVKKVVAPHTTDDGDAFVKHTFTGDDDGILKLRESLDTIENEVRRAADFIRKNCSDYLWMFTNSNPTLLYAGSRKMSTPFSVQHSAPRQKTTIVNSLLDASNKPSGMPSRSRAVYATPDRDQAEQFGNLSVIIPFNGGKIAATSAEDFAEVESIWPTEQPFSNGFTDDSWAGVLGSLAITLEMTPEEAANPDKWSEVSDKFEADPEFASSIYDEMIEMTEEYDWWMDDVVPHIQRSLLDTVLNRVFQYNNMSHPFTVLQPSTLNKSHPGGETVIEGDVVRLSEEMYEMVVEFLTDNKVA